MSGPIALPVFKLDRDAWTFLTVARRSGGTVWMVGSEYCNWPERPSVRLTKYSFTLLAKDFKSGQLSSRNW